MYSSPSNRKSKSKGVELSSPEAKDPDKPDFYDIDTKKQSPAKIWKDYE